MLAPLGVSNAFHFNNCSDRAKREPDAEQWPYLVDLWAFSLSLQLANSG